MRVVSETNTNGPKIKTGFLSTLVSSKENNSKTFSWNK
jgi:hypothetical protein